MTGLLDHKDSVDMSGIVKGKKALALHFGKSERQMRRWVKDPTFPKLSGGRFDLLQVQAWLDLRDGKPRAATRAADPRQPELPTGKEQHPPARGKEAEETRLKKVSADIKELELRKLQGELIALVEVEALLAPRAMAYRQGIVGLRRTAPPMIAARLGLPAEAMRIIEDILGRVGAEILANVLRALTLPAGQVLSWESEDSKAAQGGA